MKRKVKEKKFHGKLLLTLLVLLLLLAGCEKGSYKLSEGELSHKGRVYRGEYKQFDGHIEYALGKKKEVALSYNVTTLSGELSVEILDKDREVVEKTDVDSIQGVLTEVLKEKENVYLRIEGKKHEGSYYIENLEE